MGVVGKFITPCHIVHHVRGRLRLRLHAGMMGWLAQSPHTPEDWLARLPGIQQWQLNHAAASLVIFYDVQHIPPTWWERLFSSRYDALPTLLAEIGVISPATPSTFHSSSRSIHEQS